MVEIYVSATGQCTGDTGSVIGYGDSQQSAEIAIMHPSNNKLLHRILYRQRGITCGAYLDNEDHIKLPLCGPGILRCQYVQEDPLTLKTVFCSQEFDLIVAQVPMRPNFKPMPASCIPASGEEENNDAAIEAIQQTLTEVSASLSALAAQLNGISEKVSHLEEQANAE